MSYDYFLLKIQPGEASQTAIDRTESSNRVLSLDPENEALKFRTAKALIAYDPKLEIFQRDYKAIAKAQRISIQEARLKFRDLEINGPPEDEYGIQISLYDDHAFVTIPYWHSGQKADNAFDKIMAFLKIIAHENGYSIYDPQTETIIEMSAASGTTPSTYKSVMHKIGDISSPPTKVKKPFWKLW